MRKMLTISEVSKLLETSIHTIRYYEKEGLIMPTNRTSGGYRLYDMEALDRLETVILLRECGIGLKDIRDLLHDYTEEKYTQILDTSYSMVSDEIKKLKAIKKKLGLVRSVRKDFVDGDIKLIQRTNLNLIMLERIDDRIYSSPVEIFELYEKYGKELQTEADGVFFFTSIEGQLTLCRKANREDEESLIFKGGQYLSYIYKGDIGNQAVLKAINVMENYCIEHAFKLEGYPIIQLSSIRSMAIGDISKDVVELLCKVAETRS